MGTFARRKPERLADKLLELRKGFGDSQNGLIRRLGFSDELIQSDISAFERGTREPPLTVLLQYARAANLYVEALIDDDLELPEKLPARSKSEGIKKARKKKGR